MPFRQRWFDRCFAFDLPLTSVPGLLERLRGAPARLADRVAALPPAVRTAKPDGAWSVQENVGHLLDLEPLWWARWENFQAGAATLVPADLENRQTNSANHNAADLDQLLSKFGAARGRFVSALTEAADTLWIRSATHPRLQQPMRLIDHALFVAEHDDHHLITISGLMHRLGADGVTFRSATRADSDVVRALVFGILREFGFTPDPAGTDADLADLEASYLTRGGAFELVYDSAGELLGCAGVYPMKDATAELRKMYLRPAARGRGLGRRLLDHSLARARALGFRVMVLQTASILRDAIALYRRSGFLPYQPTHRVPRCDVALRLDLAGSATEPSPIRGSQP